MMRDFVLIRHGQSQHNAKQTDSLDSLLTPRGLAQAKLCGEALLKMGVSLRNYRLYCSPLARCLSTMEEMLSAQGIDYTPVAKSGSIHNAAYTISPSLRDWSSDLFVQSLRSHFKHETAPEVAQRVTAAFGDLCYDSKVVVVAHASVVDGLVRCALGQPYDQAHTGSWVKNAFPYRLMVPKTL